MWQALKHCEYFCPVVFSQLSVLSYTSLSDCRLSSDFVNGCVLTECMVRRFAVGHIHRQLFWQDTVCIGLHNLGPNFLRSNLSATVMCDEVVVFKPGCWCWIQRSVTVVLLITEADSQSFPLCRCHVTHV